MRDLGDTKKRKRKRKKMKRMRKVGKSKRKEKERWVKTGERVRNKNADRR